MPRRNCRLVMVTMEQPMLLPRLILVTMEEPVMMPPRHRFCGRSSSGRCRSRGSGLAECGR
ncbi:MAG: hypothetical protein JO117_11145 [Verrucomicrobia bacterium]|nr:hypothetical protein [Verrucomicrobiota bacterium]